MELISSIGMTFAPASRAIVEVESVDESLVIPSNGSDESRSISKIPIDGSQYPGGPVTATSHPIRVVHFLD